MINTNNTTTLTYINNKSKLLTHSTTLTYIKNKNRLQTHTYYTDIY